MAEEGDAAMYAVGEIPPMPVIGKKKAQAAPLERPAAEEDVDAKEQDDDREGDAVPEGGEDEGNEGDEAGEGNEEGGEDEGDEAGEEPVEESEDPGEGVSEAPAEDDPDSEEVEEEPEPKPGKVKLPKGWQRQYEVGAQTLALTARDPIFARQCQEAWARAHGEAVPAPPTALAVEPESAEPVKKYMTHAEFKAERDRLFKAGEDDALEDLRIRFSEERAEQIAEAKSAPLQKELRAREEADRKRADEDRRNRAMQAAYAENAKMVETFKAEFGRFKSKDGREYTDFKDVKLAEAWVRERKRAPGDTAIECMETAMLRLGRLKPAAAKPAPAAAGKAVVKKPSGPPPRNGQKPGPAVKRTRDDDGLVMVGHYPPMPRE